MVKNKWTLSFLVIFIFTAACGQLKSAPQPLPSPSRNWTLIMMQSGGFAGVSLSARISSNGQLIAEDQRSNRSVTQTLSSQTMAKLNQLVSGISVSANNNPQSGCADCFIYDLEIQSEESDFHINVDDVTLKDSSASELIPLIIKLRDDALHSNP